MLEFSGYVRFRFNQEILTVHGQPSRRPGLYCRVVQTQAYQHVQGLRSLVGGLLVKRDCEAILN